MKKTTICQIYYFSIICNLFALLCGVAGIIIMLIYSNEFTSNQGKIFELTVVIVIIVAFIFLVLLSTKKLIALFKDYNAVKSKNYISIIGKVIKFKRNREPESGVQINDQPIITILDTNEEIVLIINDKILIGEIYKFNYLYNSKIAEIVEKI